MSGENNTWPRHIVTKLEKEAVIYSTQSILQKRPEEALFSPLIFASYKRNSKSIYLKLILYNKSYE